MTCWCGLPLIESFITPSGDKCYAYHTHESGVRMKCYYCDQPMASGRAKYDTWGARRVLAHKVCDRDDLIARGRELGVFGEFDQHSDQEIIDAIAADRLAGEFLDRLDKLPNEEAQRDAVHRLRLSMDNYGS